MTRGHFITLEGGEGTGKSTQAARLVARLAARGLDVVHTREPGGSPGAEEIRHIALNGDAGRWSPLTETLLMFASRSDHLEKTIRPALARGDIVITDRFADSTRMYQGISRGDLVATVNQLHDLMIGVEPDLTFLIDIDPAVGHGRALARAGAEMRFEAMGLALQTRMRAGFLALATQDPRFQVVSGDADPADVARTITEIALAHLDPT